MEIEKICKNCKYWEEIELELVEDIQKYDNLPSGTMRECQAIPDKCNPVAWICESEVYYISEGSNNPSLITGPDFGCMLWEKTNDLAL